MTTENWIVAGALTAIAAMASVGVWMWYRMFGIWKTLPGFREVSYAGKVDPNVLAAALSKADYLLLSGVHWQPAHWPRTRMRGLKVYVRDTLTWTTGSVKVAGVLQGNIAVVGSDLAALCHELAHFYRRVLDGVDTQRDDGPTDVEEHREWLTNGIQAAIDQYDAWIKGGVA